VIDVARAILLSTAGLVAFGLVFVMPGFRLAERLAGPDRTLTARLMLALVVSQVLVVGVGIGLVAIGLFSGTLLAAVAVALAVASAPAAARWCRDLRPVLPVVGWIAILSVPWVASVGLAGSAPADSLQWYYADLGRVLSQTGGIPSLVAEWGVHVRWLPDYLAFNVTSEAYRALLPFVAPEDALAAWRVPVAILGLVTIVAVLRLWLSRGPALVGGVLVAGGTFYIAKFDAYKPESVGIVLGLVAVWLVVAGLRHGRRSWVLLAGAVLGIDLSVHAIAALAMGLLVVSLGGAEWLALKRERMSRLDWLVRAALIGVVLSVAMGVGLQGRAVVAGDALRPTLSAGQDPTWTFFLRSTGDFAQPAPRPPSLPLAGGVTTPWPGLRITSAFGWWLLPVVAIGAYLQLALAGRRTRAGTVGAAGAGVLLGLTIAFFAIAFHTYVPRWTGLVRFGQYVPLIVGGAVAVGLDGYLRAWLRMTDMRTPRALVAVAAIAAALWLVPGVTGRYQGQVGISPAGSAALVELRTLAAPGDVVLSNVLTTGTIEFFAPVEAPLEGRQPLIEQPGFLDTANRLLLDAHAWFTGPAGAPGDSLVDRLGARWVLVADDAAALGSDATVGGNVAGMAGRAGLEQVWSAPGIALFRATAPAANVAATDVRTKVVDLPRSLGAGLVGGAICLALVLLPWRRRGSASALAD
jgi:hypothetical protein